MVAEKQIRRGEYLHTTLCVVISLYDYPFFITNTTGRTCKRSLYHEIIIGQDAMD
jgi:hypothetical protein